MSVSLNATRASLNVTRASLSLSTRVWCEVLRLGVSHGWEPEGTYRTTFSQGRDDVAEAELLDEVNPHPVGSDARGLELAFDRAWAPDQPTGGESEWLGYNYSANDGQLVTAEDAARLALALQRAHERLVALSDQEPNESDGDGVGPEASPVVAWTLRESCGAVLHADRVLHTDLEWRGRERLALLDEVIVFCQHGGFIVW